MMIKYYITTFIYLLVIVPLTLYLNDALWWILESLPCSWESHTQHCPLLQQLTTVFLYYFLNIAMKFNHSLIYPGSSNTT